MSQSCQKCCFRAEISRTYCTEAETHTPKRIHHRLTPELPLKKVAWSRLEMCKLLKFLGCQPTNCTQPPQVKDWQY